MTPRSEFSSLELPFNTSFPINHAHVIFTYVFRFYDYSRGVINDPAGSDPVVSLRQRDLIPRLIDTAESKLFKRLS
jgi:hypothetical protein